jgi:hypothetical protein
VTPSARFYGPLALSEAHNVAETVCEVLESTGFSKEEAIPGLVQAIVMLAEDDDRFLDAAANLLADGGL